jgi:chemotaxis protein CheD
MVGIAEQLVSADPDDVLVTLGLGSCIGLAVVDVTARVAGAVAHRAAGVVRREGGLGATVQVRRHGRARPARGRHPGRWPAGPPHGRALWAGASMFPGAPGMGRLAQIGERNTARTLAALAAHRIAVRGRDTGGSSGRSVEVHVATGQVLVRAARPPPSRALSARTSRRR